ncbi:MAG: hypothetical protein P8182_07685 [Deltaproteobacteria bacterium]
MQTQDYREEQFEARANQHTPEVEETDREAPQERQPDTDGLLSEQEVNELVFAAQVETELRSVYPCEVVMLHDGIVTVDVDAPLLQEARLVEEFNRAAEKISGVKEVRVHILPTSIYGLG